MHFALVARLMHAAHRRPSNRSVLPAQKVRSLSALTRLATWSVSFFGAFRCTLTRPLLTPVDRSIPLLVARMLHREWRGKGGDLAARTLDRTPIAAEDRILDGLTATGTPSSGSRNAEPEMSGLKAEALPTPLVAARFSGLR